MLPPSASRRRFTASSRSARVSEAHLGRVEALLDVPKPLFHVPEAHFHDLAPSLELVKPLFEPAKPLFELVEALFKADLRASQRAHVLDELHHVLADVVDGRAVKGGDGPSSVLAAHPERETAFAISRNLLLPSNFFEENAALRSSFLLQSRHRGNRGRRCG